MSEQEMQFADPDWKPTGARRTQQNNTAAYVPQPLHNNAFDTSQSADVSSYGQGYRGSLRQEQMPYASPYAQQMPPHPAGSTRARSRWWIWVIVLIIVFSIISSTSHSFNGIRSYPQGFDGPVPAQQVNSFDLGNASLVSINDFSGSIQLQVGDINPNQIEVQTDAANGKALQEGVNGGTLTITMNPSQGSGDIVVILPPQVAISLETSSGNIEVDGYTGQVSAQTDSGSINLNGDALSGSSVISSNSGNIDFNGTLDPQGTYSFTTDQGSIDLTLPANTSMRVQKSIGVGGSFSSDFRTSTGNAPQAALDVKTSSGAVNIYEQQS